MAIETKTEKRYSTTTKLKINDRIRTPKGHLLIINDIWIERFHLDEQITYVSYDFISASGHTGSEQKTIGALLAFLRTEAKCKIKAALASI